MSFNLPPLDPRQQWALSVAFILTVGLVVLWEAAPYTDESYFFLFGDALIAICLGAIALMSKYW